MIIADSIHIFIMSTKITRMFNENHCGKKDRSLTSQSPGFEVLSLKSHFYPSSIVENKKCSKKRPKFRKNISGTFLVVSSAF